MSDHMPKVWNVEGQAVGRGLIDRVGPRARVGRRASRGVASRHSLRVRVPRLRPMDLWLLAIGGLIVLSVGLLSGCAVVPQYQRGELADPIMSYERDERLEQRELHWMEAREASSGGNGGAGGGCACN